MVPDCPPPLLERNLSLPLNLAAIAVLIEDALKLCFGGKLTIFTSHQVKQLLNGRGYLWMSNQRIARRNINNLRYADDTTLMAQSEEELKSLLMKVKEKSEKVHLKLNKKLTSWHPVPSLYGK